MFRSLSLAIGISLCILGAECLLVDKFVMAADEPATVEEPQAVSPFSENSQPVAARQTEYTPPEWMPWSFLSAGAIVIIYSFTLPQRMNG